MAPIRYRLGRMFFPGNEWTRDRDGSPILPYDMTTDTMFKFMGVRVGLRHAEIRHVASKGSRSDYTCREADLWLFRSGAAQRQFPRGEPII